MTGAISQDWESCQFPFVLDEKPTFVPGGSAGEGSGGKRKVSYGDTRSNSEQAAPSACVGKRYSVAQRAREYRQRGEKAPIHRRLASALRGGEWPEPALDDFHVCKRLHDCPLCGCGHGRADGPKAQGKGPQPFSKHTSSGWLTPSTVVAGAGRRPQSARPWAVASASATAV